MKELQTENDFSSIKPEGRNMRVHMRALTEPDSPPLYLASALCTHTTLLHPSKGQMSALTDKAELASEVCTPCYLQLVLIF